MTFNSEQEQFWAETYAEDYIAKNSQFDHELGAAAWKTMLSACDSEISNFLELGCNIGRNLQQLSICLPAAKPSVVEISVPAFNFVNSQFELEHGFRGLNP